LSDVCIYLLQVYSIEMVKTEGLHLQLEAASTDARRAQLETRIQASPSKKEVRRLPSCSRHTIAAANLLLAGPSLRAGRHGEHPEDPAQSADVGRALRLEGALTSLKRVG
jgi:hypothetical protein